MLVFLFHVPSGRGTLFSKGLTILNFPLWKARNRQTASTSVNGSESEVGGTPQMRPSGALGEGPDWPDLGAHPTPVCPQAGCPRTSLTAAQHPAPSDGLSYLWPLLRPHWRQGSALPQSKSHSPSLFSTWTTICKWLVYVHGRQSHSPRAPHTQDLGFPNCMPPFVRSVKYQKPEDPDILEA